MEAERISEFMLMDVRRLSQMKIKVDRGKTLGASWMIVLPLIFIVVTVLILIFMSKSGVRYAGISIFIGTIILIYLIRQISSKTDDYYIFDMGSNIITHFFSSLWIQRSRSFDFGGVLGISVNGDGYIGTHEGKSLVGERYYMYGVVLLINPNEIIRISDRYNDLTRVNNEAEKLSQLLGFNFIPGQEKKYIRFRPMEDNRFEPVFLDIIL